MTNDLEIAIYARQCSLYHDNTTCHCECDGSRPQPNGKLISYWAHLDRSRSGVVSILAKCFINHICYISCIGQYIIVGETTLDRHTERIRVGDTVLN